MKDRPTIHGLHLRQGQVQHRNVLSILAVSFEGNDWLLVTDLCERK